MGTIDESVDAVEKFFIDLPFEKIDNVLVTLRGLTGTPHDLFLVNVIFRALIPDIVDQLEFVRTIGRTKRPAPENQETNLA